jgi:hypothetical protein
VFWEERGEVLRRGYPALFLGNSPQKWAVLRYLHRERRPCTTEEIAQNVIAAGGGYEKSTDVNSVHHVLGRLKQDLRVLGIRIPSVGPGGYDLISTIIAVPE